jgi:hypothetical protein
MMEKIEETYPIHHSTGEINKYSYTTKQKA